MSSEREAQASAFLAANGLASAARYRLPADASTRRYDRLTLQDGRSLIFMDQPPSAETHPCPPDATPQQREALGYNALARLAAGRVEAFIACAEYLTSRGLSAPNIIAADPAAGFAVLEDLGEGMYARLIEQGQDEAPLYDAAIDALVTLHSEAPPAVLPGGWPLLDYDAVALATGSELFVDWLPKFAPQVRFDAAAIAEWNALWAPVHAHGAAGASVFCHRDYHAENLIWLPERVGAARVGLLDFQDAVKAHPAWDLSMLLHDARRDISPEREEAALARYFAGRPEVDRAQMLSDFSTLGALNIVRILGIFSRLVVRDSKPKYAAFMPRMWGYLDRVLAHPDLAPIAAFLDAHVPREARK